MRLAWFTPWPPQRSGVATRSAELVPALAARGHAIDVFVDSTAVPATTGSADAPQPGAWRVLSAHEFIWRQARGQYDLPVYQVGNSVTHDVIWSYMFRWPGLVVLHDARLYHARTAALLWRRLFTEYRAEFQWNQPDVSPDLAELVIQGVPSAGFYEWPMRRTVVESARLVASHARGVVSMLRDEHPGRPVEYIALGEGRGDLNVAACRRRFRSAHGISESAPVFGVFGALTEEKRVPQVLRAFAATRPWTPDAQLVLAGTPDPQLDLMSAIETLGIGDAVHVIARASDDEFDDAIAACDVGLALRWPTALETSGPWLRLLAAGRATVIVDLAHQRHVPALDPRTWRRHAPTDDLGAGADARAITVAIDIIDEDHSLRLAMRRLAGDTALRDRLGLAARRYWDAEHTVDRMVADYERVLADACTRPAPSPDLPAHLWDDGTSRVRELLAPFGIAMPF